MSVGVGGQKWGVGFPPDGLEARSEERVVVLSPRVDVKTKDSPGRRRGRRCRGPGRTPRDLLRLLRRKPGRGSCGPRSRVTSGPANEKRRVLAPSRSLDQSPLRKVVHVPTSPRPSYGPTSVLRSTGVGPHTVGTCVVQTPVPSSRSTCESSSDPTRGPPQSHPDTVPLGEEVVPVPVKDSLPRSLFVVAPPLPFTSSIRATSTLDI